MRDKDLDICIYCDHCTWHDACSYHICMKDTDRNRLDLSQTKCSSYRPNWTARYNKATIGD